MALASGSLQSTQNKQSTQNACTPDEILFSDSKTDVYSITGQDKKKVVNANNPGREIEKAKKRIAGDKVVENLKEVLRKNPIHRQALALQYMTVESGTKKEAMRKAGYSEAVAKKPSQVTNTQSFKALCTRLGLTDNLLVSSLKDDIIAKPGRRVRELVLGFRVAGLDNGSKGGNTINITQNTLRVERQREILDVLEGKKGQET